ncbi:hypothetical protein LA6_004849 [Marinibacterium anthonyi]|nr:hypothetical protein LA6_004849 [Marinibacterium anthonyi]
MPDYTLYYWPIPFRGHFIRFTLARAGAIWDEAGTDGTVTAMTAPVGGQPCPFMAPPLLHDHANDRWLPQMPAIVMHLARRHGLSSDPDLELRLLCDANDVLFEITRYHGAMMWDRDSWQTFRDDRLPRWMQIHEAMLFAETEDPTLADIILTALWHTMIDRLPPLRPLLTRHAPKLEARVDHVAATPAIAGVLRDWADREPRYCAGQIEASLLEMLRG